MSQLTVSKVAEQAGTSSDTLRYYERIGLLPPPERSPSGYRLYDAETVERVRFIKRAQRFGLRLEDIAELLDIRERGLCPCGRTRRLLEARVAELDGEMEAMARLRDDIQRILDDNLGEDGDGAWQCGASLLQIKHKPTINNISNITNRTRGDRR